MSDPAQARSHGPLLPPLALGVCVLCLSILGVLTNLGLLTIFIKRYKRGVVPIVIQIIITDMLLLCTSLWPELWANNIGTWDFGYYGCLTHRGFNAFASSASAYLVVALALHSLALIKLGEKTTAQTQKILSCNEDEEIESSCHSLVTKSDSLTPPRTINIDYTTTKAQVSVCLPTTFLWVLCASLSVPEFVLATTVHLKHDSVQCMLLETNTPFHMYWMFAVGNLVISILILLTAAIHISFKMITDRKTLSQVDRDLYSGLKLSLWLIAVYTVMCAPRKILHIYSAYWSLNTDENPAVTWTNQKYTLTGLRLGFGVAAIAACLIRPILYVIIMPRVSDKISLSKCVNRK